MLLCCFSISFERLREARIVPVRFVFRTDWMVSKSVRGRSEE